MTTLTESRRPSSFLLSEAHGALDFTASDGFQVAAAVALYGCATSAAGRGSAAGITRMAEVMAPELIWPAAMTPTQQAFALSQLREHDIIVR